MTILQEFVSSIFWRIPAHDQLYFEQYEREPMLSYIREIVKKSLDKDATDETIEKFRKSDFFKKGLRPAAVSASLLANKNNNFLDWGITYVKSENQVCSDNPIVLLNDKADNIFQCDIIFPLSKNHLLIKSRKKFTVDDLKEIKMLADILIFKQGSSFCCCPNHEYLSLVFENAKRFTNDEVRLILTEYFTNTTNG